MGAEEFRQKARIQTPPRPHIQGEIKTTPRTHNRSKSKPIWIYYNRLIMAQRNEIINSKVSNNVSPAKPSRLGQIYDYMNTSIIQRSTKFNHPAGNVTDITTKINEYRLNNHIFNDQISRKYADDVMYNFLNAKKVPEITELDVVDEDRIKVFADLCLLHNLEIEQEKPEIITYIIIIIETWREVARTAQILDRLERKCPAQKGDLRRQRKFEELINKTSKVLDDLEEILALCGARLTDVSLLLNDKA